MTPDNGAYVKAKGRFDCHHPGCPKGSRTTGDAVFRISPKGETFVGLCAEHFAEYGGEREHQPYNSGHNSGCGV